MARRRLGIARTVRRLAITRGLFGGQRAWAVLGGVFWLLRFIRRGFGKNEQTVALERLLPGQSMTLTAIRPETRRQRKRARKAVRSAARVASRATVS
jgi:hypothetical protein